MANTSATVPKPRLYGTAINYPPMQKPASFNLEAVKEKIDEMMKSREG